jgi:PKD repeat protein
LVLSGLGASAISPSQSTTHKKERNLSTNPDDTSTYIFYTTMEEKEASRDWSIVETYPIPEGASGLAYDGTNLYCGIYGANGNEIYQIDPATGSYSLLFSGPQDDAFGLTYDGTYLWTTDHPGSSSTPALALQLDWNGNLLSQFDLPDHYMSGIAYDNGDFWVATYYPDPSIIYKVDSTGMILTQFTAPDNQPWDLCLENNYLWMADYWGDTLYKIDPTTGTMIESHASESSDPAGIVYDGQYLWYCDNGQGGSDYLYKVDLLGGGTPEINVPETSHEYGPVSVGDSVTWNAVVESVGTADLVIHNVTFSGSEDVSCPVSFPITVSPGDDTELPLVYAPQDAEPLNALATVHSNDPITPEVDITLTGNGVYPGPDIFLPEDSHNYGVVRTYATTRWYMEIQNIGDETLEITDITSDDTHFYLDSSVNFPITIGVLSSEEISIWFRPTEADDYSATLSIESNDPDENPYFVSVEGTGDIDEYPIGDTLWHYQITTSYDNSPKAVASLSDINNDWIDDVIVCSEDDYVRCFNGNSDGIADILWEHEIYAGSVYSQKGLTITQDLDDDGYQDVIVGAAWGARLIRAISGKTGQTIWTHDTHEYGDGGWVYQVDCRYDYDGDGVFDVLATTGDDSSDTGPKRVYCLNGVDGTSIWEYFLGGPGFSVIGVEDFTGDGQTDVVAGASNEAETQGYAYGLNGVTGAFEWSFTATGTSVWALEQIDDITGDDIADVIIGDFYGNIYGLDATNGNQEYTTSVGSYTIISRFDKLDDVNGDDHPDILPGHFGTSAHVIDGQTGNFIWSHPVADKPTVVSRIADVSGDGVNDVLVGTLFSSNYCYFLNGVDGTELKAIALSTPADAIAAIPDIIGDGSMEMVLGGRNGMVYCFSGGLNALNPLTADFTADETEGVAPLTVQFTDLSTAQDTTITSWKWDFESDGIIDLEEQNPAWIYDEEGIYTVTLIISDGEFWERETKENYITVFPSGEGLEIGEITGGFLKIDAEIINNKDSELTDVTWSIKLDGGFILLGRNYSDILASIPAEDTVTVTDFLVFGIGRVEITVRAEAEGASPAEKTVNGFVFLFFVIIR